MEATKMECFVCGKKLKFIGIKYNTKDQQKICDDCMHRLFGRNTGFFKTNNIIDWISHHTALTVKHYIDKGQTLTMKADGSVGGDTDLFCPYCNSENVQPLGQHHNGFSMGKAVGGAVLGGGVGAVAGFLGKGTKQTDFVCMNCGKQFKK